LDRLVKIDIYELVEGGDSLLCDLVAAAPSDQNVSGYETVEGKIVAVFDKADTEGSIIQRWKGSPPRDTFDLRDAGKSILIEARRRAPEDTSHSKAVGHRSGCLLIPVRTLESDLQAAIEITSIPEFKTRYNFVFLVLETEDVPRHFDETLSTLGPIAPVRLSHRPQNTEWKTVETKTKMLGKTITITYEEKIVSPLALRECQAIWTWLSQNYDMPKAQSDDPEAFTKEERDTQLADIYNGLRRTIPPQLASPVQKLGGHQADVIMMLIGVIDGTMRLYIDKDKHSRQLDFMFSHLRNNLLKDTET